MTRTPDPITDQDGPFTHSFVAVTAIPGLKLPEDADPLVVASFPTLHAEAVLTHDWESHCSVLDCATAIGAMLFTAFNGTRRSRLFRHWNRIRQMVFGTKETFLKNLARESSMAAELRRKEHSSTGCYLVYRAQGCDLIEAPRLHAARRFGRVGFGIGVINGESYRATHEPAVHATATALSLLLSKSTGSPDVRPVGDVIFLEGSDGLIVFCKVVTGHAVSIVTTSVGEPDSLLEPIPRYASAILLDDEIQAATTLMVQSQRKSNNNLESFTAAWPALELLTKRLAAKIREDWAELLRDDPNSLPDCDRDLTTVAYRNYTLREKFYAISCVLDLASAANDVAQFAEVYEKRNGFYHDGTVKAEDLPTSAAQMLFRKYLRLALDEAEDAKHTSS